MRPDPTDRQNDDGEERGPVLNGAPEDREGFIPNVEVSLSMNAGHGAVDSWSMPSGAVEYVRADNGTILLRILPVGVSSSAELGLGPLDQSELAGDDFEPQAPMTTNGDGIPHAPAAVSEGNDHPAAGTEHDDASDAPAQLRSGGTNPTGGPGTLKVTQPEEDGTVQEDKEGQKPKTQEEGQKTMVEEEKDKKKSPEAQEGQKEVKNASQKRQCNATEMEESCSKKAKIKDI